MSLQTVADVPGRVAYEHLHFGVWAGLDEAIAAGALCLPPMHVRSWFTSRAATTATE